MKKKRFGQVLLVMLITGLFYSTGAVAAEEWYICTIDSVGTEVVKSGKKTIARSLVTLDDEGGDFTDTEFAFTKKANKEMLATVLTATANGFQIEVLVDLLSGATPLVINELHLVVNP